MRPIVLPNLRDGYVELVNAVMKHGKPVAPRGYKTWEITDATFTIEDPGDVMPVGVGRNLRPDIGAAEALLLVAGLSDPTFLTNVSRQFARFLDGGILHGAYGPRVRPQLVNAVRQLEVDSDTRQAIVQIWDPLYDQLESRDKPCTLNFNFRIRDDRLDMSACMRSNDVWLGTAYDVFMFTQLQHTMASALGVPIGTYTHHAYSLHIYERNVEAAEQLHAYDERGGVPFHPKGFTLEVVDSFEDAGSLMASAMERAGRIYDREKLHHPTVSDQWYERILGGYERMSRMENFTS